MYVVYVYVITIICNSYVGGAMSKSKSNVVEVVVQDLVLLVCTIAVGVGTGVLAYGLYSALIIN